MWEAFGREKDCGRENELQKGECKRKIAGGGNELKGGLLKRKELLKENC
jgi:hypothetical protein